MVDLLVQPQTQPLRGIVPSPPDRELAQMLMWMGALVAPGETSTLEGRHLGGLPMTSALRAIGVDVQATSTQCRIVGRGRSDFEVPQTPVDVGRSSTALSLITTLLAGLGGAATVTCTASVARASLNAVVKVLRLRGARLEGQFVPDDPSVLLPPLRIETGPTLSPLVGPHPLAPDARIEKLTAVASALLADGDTLLAEPVVTNERLPRALSAVGVPLETAGGLFRLSGPAGPLAPFSVSIPGNIDASLFLLSAALAHPDSFVGVRGVMRQPSDGTAWDAISESGGAALLEARAVVAGQATADVTVSGAKPRRLVIEAERALAAGAGWCALAAWAAYCRDDSHIRGLSVPHERAQRAARILEAFGVPAAFDDTSRTLSIKGGDRVATAAPVVVDPQGDPQAAMLATVLALGGQSTTTVQRADCIVLSFPRFVGSLRALGASITTEP